jgi:uncharacterized membrane protein
MEENNQPTEMVVKNGSLSNNKKKILISILVVLILAVGVYFLIPVVKKYLNKKAEDKQAQAINAIISRINELSKGGTNNPKIIGPIIDRINTKSQIPKGSVVSPESVAKTTEIINRINSLSQKNN